MQSVLVTGAAGFIGFHVARRLLADGSAVVGLDNINSYYDPDLKKARLAELAAYANFRFEQHDVADRDAIAKLFAAHRFETVIHLAAMNKVIGRDIWIGVWSLFWALVALRYWEGGGKGRGIDPGELWRRFPEIRHRILHRNCDRLALFWRYDHRRPDHRFPAAYGCSPLASSLPSASWRSA